MFASAYRSMIEERRVERMVQIADYHAGENSEKAENRAKRSLR